MVYVFEPHGDDTLISCWPLLTQHAFKLDVITFGFSRSSKKLKRYLPAIRETRHYELNEVSWWVRSVYIEEFLAWDKRRNTGSLDVRTAWEWQRDRTTRCENWLENYYQSKRVMEAVLRGFKSGDHVYAPIGLVHPYHIMLADLVVGAVAQYPHLQFSFYSEAPYNEHTWTDEIEYSHPLALTGGRSLWILPGHDSERKEKIFRAVYPTETALLTRGPAVLTNDYRFYSASSPL